MAPDNDRPAGPDNAADRRAQAPPQRDLASRSETSPRVTASADAMFELLVESVESYAVFMLDPAGHVVTWNTGAQRIKGYTAAEIVGRHFSAFFPAADVAAGKCEQELDVATRVGRFEEEGWRVRKDGSRFWANVVITALRDASGALLGFGKVTRDLTERKRAEEHGRANDQRFALLVDSVKDYALFILDPNGIVATWNSGAARIRELPGHEALRLLALTGYGPPQDAQRTKDAGFDVHLVKPITFQSLLPHLTSS